MREIKFRFWDKFDNRMRIPVGYLEQYLIFDEGKDRHFTSGVVMQYTGLKDKNGKEIYEGDILHWESHWGWYVGFENGAFRRIPLNHIQRINWKHYTLQQEGLDTWEVIGNIYENKDLLKEGE